MRVQRVTESTECHAIKDQRKETAGRRTLAEPCIPNAACRLFANERAVRERNDGSAGLHVQLRAAALSADVALAARLMGDGGCGRSARLKSLPQVSSASSSL